MRRDERLAARGDPRAKARLAMRDVALGRGPDRAEILRGVAGELWGRDFRELRSRFIPQGTTSPDGVRRGPWAPTHRITFRPADGPVSVFHVGVAEQEPDEDGAVPATTADEWERGVDSSDWWTTLPRGWSRGGLTGEERFRWRTSGTPWGVPGRLESVLYWGRIPEPPPEAHEAALAVVGRVEALNGIGVEAMSLLVGSNDADTFGRVLAGASMCDVDPYPELGVRLPSVKFLDLVLTMT